MYSQYIIIEFTPPLFSFNPPPPSYQLSMLKTKQNNTKKKKERNECSCVFASWDLGNIGPWQDEANKQRDKGSFRAVSG
jgi:hypothetical protein